ncbi:hypothetical protein QOL99_07495 [Deinococcus sp. MIMF12]|uniref:Uncharacterized protein n=1 Tax=Deinococcus rhizophilus TaxID=3049544 RepID=A0ABT7JG08_9DEIO|nr:hypothetical protein [Deinococcus rhizophilus]MDL2343994.1 hypothetical protein [Deinococcus rhizophilus]
MAESPEPQQQGPLIAGDGADAARAVTEGRQHGGIISPPGAGVNGPEWAAVH